MVERKSREKIFVYRNNNEPIKEIFLYDEYLQSYLDEFSFKFNRSVFRNTIFHKLVERVVEFKYSDKDLSEVSVIE